MLAQGCAETSHLEDRAATDDVSPTKGAPPLAAARASWPRATTRYARAKKLTRNRCRDRPAGRTPVDNVDDVNAYIPRNPPPLGVFHDRPSVLSNLHHGMTNMTDVSKPLRALLAHSCGSNCATMASAEVLGYLSRQRQAAAAAQQSDRAAAFASFESLYDRRYVLFFFAASMRPVLMLAAGVFVPFPSVSSNLQALAPADAGVIGLFAGPVDCDECGGPARFAHLLRHRHRVQAQRALPRADCHRHLAAARSEAVLAGSACLAASLLTQFFFRRPS